MKYLQLIAGITLLLAVFSNRLAGQEKDAINVLFIGNSYTFRHDLPQLVKAIFEEGQPGLRVDTTRIVYGGQDMFKHSNYYFTQSFLAQKTITDKTLLERIKKMEGFLKITNAPQEYADYYTRIARSRVPAFVDSHKHISRAIEMHRRLLEKDPRTRWDYVVLQSWRDVLPSLNTGYAKNVMEFVKIARTQSTKVILYFTAPDIQNSIPVKAPLLQQRVNLEVALAAELAKEIDAYAVVPVPLAINMIQQNGTALKFCYKNDKHPNQYTAFLTANMFYAAFFKQSTAGFRFNTVTETHSKGQGKERDPDGGNATVVFDGATKKYLQEIAFDAVSTFDKLLK